MEDSLYQQAVVYTQEQGGINSPMLAQGLNIEPKVAKELIARMETEGVIGPAKGRHPRDLLSPDKNTNDNLPSRPRSARTRALTRRVSPPDTMAMSDGISPEIAKLVDSSLTGLATQIGMLFLKERINSITENRPTPQG